MKITGLSALHPEKQANIKKEIKTPSVLTTVKPVAAGSPKGKIPGPQASSLPGTQALPQDRLSASIVSFARFFSLPLEPGLLAKIRRQAFSGSKPLEQADRLEALSLAASAAVDKGVELSRAGLEKYAWAVSRFDPEQEEGENNQKESKKPETHSPDIASIAGDISKLKNHILQTAEQSPLLRLLNRLPGKNGQRWLALPFNFTGQGGEYRACMKILLDGATGRVAGRMVLDVANTDSVKSTRQLFILNSENGKNLRLKLCRYDAADQQNLVSGLSERLNIPPGQITVQSFTNNFIFETDNHKNELFSVNKEV